MSAKLSGKVDLTDFLASLPENLERNVLRGALRAGAEEYAEGAREACISKEVRETIKTSTRAEPGVVSAKVKTTSHKAPWVEYGTDDHEIKARKSPVIAIKGKIVGTSVYHPGARARPFMRDAIVTRETAAIDAIVSYAAKRATKEGILTPAPEETEE